MDYFSHAGNDGYDMMNGGSWGGNMGSYSPWGWLFMLVVMVLIVLVVVWLVRSFANNKTGSSKEDALDIVKQRYAKGEITKKQFDDMKQDLK